MIYVIGDIHGARDKLDQLMARINPTPVDRLIFLGDYIDYGPASSAVIEYLLDLKTPSVFLMGNHESMMMSFLGQRGVSVGRGELYLEKGGVATLQSYDIAPATSASFDQLPARHRSFLQGLQLTHRERDYLCVHGGLGDDGWKKDDVERALAASSAMELLWDRSTPQRAHNLNVTLVYGHTVHPSRKVQWNLPYSIGIDTGTAFGGPLTALCLDDLRIIQAN